MKKKKNSSGEDSESDETFPVDTLGIPILVDVVESATTLNAEEELDIQIDISETESVPLDLRPESDQRISTELPAEAHLDQITGKIAKSVTGDILAALEPLVRDKVCLALRMYEDELLKLPDEESEKKLESD